MELGITKVFTDAMAAAPPHQQKSGTRYQPTSPHYCMSNKETHDLQMSPMAPTTCRKCNKSGSDLDRFPCHSKEGCCNKCLMKIYDGACLVKDCPCHEEKGHSTPEVEEWEKEAKRIISMYCASQKGRMMLLGLIRNNCNDQRATLRSRVEGLRKEVYEDQHMGYNQALDDVLALINL